MAFNGSPRKGWNTALLLEKALEGAAAKGAITEIIHLYDLKYKGCVSCFSCKEKGGKNYGRCAVRDDLSEILARVKECDAVILGSPIYLASITGETQSFLERLVFPFLTYTDPPGTLFPRRIPFGLIYTMGLPEDLMEKFGYPQRFQATERLLSRIFGPCSQLLSFDTLQFEDYSKYVAPRFDPVTKAMRRREVFPEDLRKAYELGQSMVMPG